MKTTHLLFTFGLLSFVLCLACAQVSPSPKTYDESQGKSWLTNYYGKTLSSIGKIVTIRIDRTPSATYASATNWTHRALWDIIEHSKMQDYYSASVALGIPPKFNIEYEDGLRVRADAYIAWITLADGREGTVILLQELPQ